MDEYNDEGSRPEWCISSMIYSGDIPFWSETLEVFWRLITGNLLVTCFDGQCDVNVCSLCLNGSCLST